MSNNRIFYACQAVAIAKTGVVTGGGTGFRIMQGVQSVGINTNFTLEQAFELGQLELYANEEEIAEVEVTIEKLIDGRPFLYLQSVGEIGKTNVVSASNSRCDVYLAVYSDSVSSLKGATAPENVVMCSGMFVSSVSYTYPVDGFATESVTLVGNDKFWNTAGSGPIGYTDIAATFAIQSPAAGATGFDGTDAPLSGVVRRAKVDIAGSTIPAEVKNQSHLSGATGISSNLGIQTITINADMGRENQLELGRFGPYNRYATFPFEVTCEFETTATRGDLVSASGQAKNLTDREIKIKDTVGTVIDLGTKNKLTSVAYTGGDTGGGVATVTYSYSTYNTLKVDGGGYYW